VQRAGSHQISGDQRLPTAQRIPAEAAAEQFDRWRRDGVLVDDSVESFTIYRMTTLDDDGGERRAELESSDRSDSSRPDEGQILCHEQQDPEGEERPS